mmetsp:Transcript_101930/g.247745  ORF Transcript_101930/g.247745 Transcript_101930/m.247745 type:complete len:245 (+) Transcript_101930:454-1188(+)
MIASVSDSASASSMLCVVSSTTRPRFTPWMRSHTWRRLSGSMPVVGSSRHSTRLPEMRLSATLTRRFMPPLNCPTGLLATPLSFTHSSTSVMLSATSDGLTPRNRAKMVRCSTGDRSSQSWSCCGQTPRCCRTASSSSFTLCPATKASPSVGPWPPVITFTSVVLPAPLCPRRQKICPSRMSRSTPSTAVFLAVIERPDSWPRLRRSVCRPPNTFRTPFVLSETPSAAAASPSTTLRPERMQPQ